MTSQPTDAAVLVTGATSGIGRELVQMLTEAGEPVRALCRRQEQVDAFEAAGVHAVLGDLDDRASLQSAMDGADRLFLLTAPLRTQQAHGQTAVQAAAAAGLRRVVHLSTADANPNSVVPWASAPAHTDALLKASGLDWTLLKPTAFMQNLLQSAAPVRRGLLPQTSGKGATGWIDTHDIAAVAARALTESGHEGQEYILTGPELLSMPDIAVQLGAVTGRRVRYVHLPSALFYALLRATGNDAWTARGLRRQFVDIVRDGHDNGTVLTDNVRVLTGREPRSFRQFAEQNRAAFATS